MKQISLYFLLMLTSIVSVFAGNSGHPEVTPTELLFQRLAVRRFIFSNNITLNEFIPSEIVSFQSMHPAFTISETNSPKVYENFRPKIKKGKLHLDQSCGHIPASIYIGGVNPYATYEVNVESFSSDKGIPEVGLELARLGLRDRIQVIAKLTGKSNSIIWRAYKNNQLERETILKDVSLTKTFSLKVQLYGRSLGVFITQDSETQYIGHIPVNEHFGDILDFRKVTLVRDCSFNLISNLKGEVVVNKAQSYLSAGMGQADIRLVSYEDLSPYLEDGRLWFTFSCRGLDTPQSAQGVLSLDPSVFDIKFEGMIVFDHGDGMLRNDYASHLFYDRKAEEWRAYSCDFGGTAHTEGRTGSGLLTAVSPKDPRKGFSVMKATRIETSSVDSHNEDPCIFYDEEAGKWRLLTSIFHNNHITSRMLESDTWNGKFTPITHPIEENSTGTSIQKIGGKYYAFMGGHGNLRVHSYPDLKEVGELNLPLQPHWPKPAGRIWASVVPLPEGYPYKYVLLTMDRPNFPGVVGPNWSYGALYFYGSSK